MSQKLTFTVACIALAIGAMAGSNDTTAPVKPAFAQAATESMGSMQKSYDTKTDAVPTGWQESFGPTGVRVRSPIPAPKPPEPILIPVPVPVQSPPHTIIINQAPAPTYSRVYPLPLHGPRHHHHRRHPF